jgi:acetyl esterase/lipase
MNSRNTILDAVSLIEPASNPKLEHKTRGFLQELNSGGATPLEQLSPKEARDLLAALQASVQAGIAQLKGLPPAHIQIAGRDVLRDEGLAYARKLDAAEVEVTLVRYDGMIHDYCFFNHLSRIPAVRSALHQAVEELKS